MLVYRVRQVKLPGRGTEGSAGIDFFIPEDWPPTQLSPGEAVNIPSGVHVRLWPGTVLVMFNKSGVALRGLQVGACVIDQDYTGEVHLHVTNITDRTVVIKPGEKLVQGIELNLAAQGPVLEAESIDTLYEGLESQRGRGAFGSTGK